MALRARGTVIPGYYCPGASLVKERSCSCRSALDRSRQFQERCSLNRSLTILLRERSCIKNKISTLITWTISFTLATTLRQRVEYKVSLLVYKCLHQAAPSYLAEMCVPVSATDNWCHLRTATHNDLAVPRIRLARCGRRSFSVSGPLLWNSLPPTVRDVSLTLTQFGARVKTFLFSRAYGTSS